MVISSRELNPPTASVRVEGEIDLATAPILRDALAEAIDAGGVQLTVDLAQVSFMAVAGIRVLLRARAEAEARAGCLIVANPSASVVRVVSAAGVRTLLAPEPQGTLRQPSVPNTSLDGPQLVRQRSASTPIRNSGPRVTSASERSPD